MEILAVIYLVFFAAIAGGAFALMSQNLRSSKERDSLQAPRKRSRVHPEMHGAHRGAVDRDAGGGHASVAKTLRQQKGRGGCPAAVQGGNDPEHLFRIEAVGLSQRHEVLGLQV